MTTKDFYVYQHPSFGLGNFINCTPAIKVLYEHFGEKIQVLFSNPIVEECYQNSAYIEIIKEPKGVELFGSHWIDQNNLRPDWHFIQLKLSVQRGVMPEIERAFQTRMENEVLKNFSRDAFIDKHPLPETMILSGVKPGGYIVFINGCGNYNDQRYIDSKQIDLETQYMIRDLIPGTIYGVGSHEDSKYNIFNGLYGSVKGALGIISHAKAVISNDSGFYHAAAAMRKKQIVLWKNTKLPKNLCTDPNVVVLKHWTPDNISEVLKNWNIETQTIIA